MVVKTIVCGSELDGRNQLKNHENMKLGIGTKIMKNKYVKSVIFMNFVNLASFHVFPDFTTDSTCPTHSHQLVFS